MQVDSRLARGVRMMRAFGGDNDRVNSAPGPLTKMLLPPAVNCKMRVEAARRELERTQKGLKQVASAAGFGNVDVMRRAFVQLLGLTPRRYRDVAARSSSA